MNQLIYQNQHLMSTAQLKDVLHHRIDQADEQFLHVIYAMVEAYAEQHQINDDEDVIGYRSGGEAITVRELKAKINLAEQQIAKGEFLTTEQLHQESEQWLKSTE